MGFLFFLFLLFIGYIILRYKETTFPLLKKVFGDIQADVGNFQSKYVDKSADPVSLPYEQRKDFFTSSELEFFQILNSHLDAHRYTVFPKVPLREFIKVSDGTKKQPNTWKHMKSEPIDYLIWDLVESRVVLAIQLEEDSHSGHFAERNGHFKNELYRKLGLPFSCVDVGTNYEQEIKKIVGML